MGFTISCGLLAKKEFARNSMPGVTNQVLHFHKTKYAFEDKVITILRDGRDVYISYFYHSLFENNLYNHEHVKRVKRKFLGKTSRVPDISQDFADFIEFVHNWEASLQRKLE